MVNILYLDEHIVVCVKKTGLLSQDAGEGSMPVLLRQQLQKKEVFPVHRLDKAVGGVMVYALTQKAAAELSRAVVERRLEKTYLAVLKGVPQQRQADLEDLLFHDKMRNKTYIVDRMRKGVKDAKLSYSVIETIQEQTLVRVLLHTGRTHQIRVQFAGRKLPLVGDGRYGGKTKESALGLWSYKLRFPHPATGEELVFCERPPCEKPWDMFEEIGLNFL